MTRVTSLTGLIWRARWVERFPGDREPDNFIRRVSGVLYSLVTPTPVARPQLRGWSRRCAEELGLEPDWVGDSQSLALLAGNLVLPLMRPYAGRYGGYQFGHWADQLGDGRAIHLGECWAPSDSPSAVGGERRPAGVWLEWQLKGAGRTPYSRSGDGRAVLRSSVREFLCSEAMHGLGVPTTRALSLLTTGESVMRDFFYDGHPAPEPGAVVCRVSPSFVRFGHFDLLRADGEPQLMEQLASALIEDHFPVLGPELARNRVEAFAQLFEQVSRLTAELMVHWMRVGFVHGVMNTDNLSILGLTVDYGPFGWMERFDPTWTPNLTDARTKRYGFAQQPGVALWNLTRLAEAFAMLGPEPTRLQAGLVLFQTHYEQRFQEMIRQKLGLGQAGRGLTAQELGHFESWIEALFSLLVQSDIDFTLFFRGLSQWLRKQSVDVEEAGSVALEAEAAWTARVLQQLTPALYAPSPLSPDCLRSWVRWFQTYDQLLSHASVAEPGGAVGLQARAQAMDQVNPLYVPRSALLYQAIQAVEQGNDQVLERLLHVWSNPYCKQPGAEDLAAKQPEWARIQAGCSSFSCSS